MKMPSIKVIKNMVGNNSPIILTVLSIGGLIGTVIMAVHATPKVLDLIQSEQWALEREYRDNSETSEETRITLSKWEAFKIAWPCYIPAAAMGLATIASIIGAHTISFKRNAALTSAYYLSETALKEYQTKIIKTIGEKKAKLIREEIGQDRVNKLKKDEKSIIITGNGQTLCCDLTTGRYFRSSVNKIQKAENEINKALNQETTMTLNEIYDYLDLSHVSMGNELEWDINRDGSLDFDIGSCISEDDEPCITIKFNAKPRQRS